MLKVLMEMELLGVMAFSLRLTEPQHIVPVAVAEAVIAPLEPEALAVEVLVALEPQHLELQIQAVAVAAVYLITLLVTVDLAL